MESLMKGIIFTTLAVMVEEKFGLELWDRVLLEVAPSSEGIYTAGAAYPDSELFAIISCLSKLTQIPANDLITAYGAYLFNKFTTYFPSLILPGISLKEFLKSIDNIIHMEVKKIHPNAALPSLTYEDSVEDELVILYRSPRKLCHLAIGLMQGASKHYQQTCEIKESLCLHKGADHCRFELKFS